MFMTTRMKLALAGEPEVPLSGVKVELYDRDEVLSDDYLDAGVTDESGEIVFKFDSKDYTDAEDGPAWRLESLPDLYVVVYSAGGERLYSTRSETVEDKLPVHFTITIDRSLAEEGGLI